MSNTAIHTHTQTNEVAVVSDEKLVSYLDSMGLTKSLKEPQKVQFLEICKAFNLNPFKREVYAVKYGDNFNIIVGYESYIKRASKVTTTLPNGNVVKALDGWNVKTEGSIKDSNLTATITIHRKDFSKPLIFTVRNEEFNTGKSLWTKMPHVMLEKVAISRGFRLAFTDELGGMPYTKEEIDTEPQDVQYTEQPTTEAEAAQILKPELKPNTDEWAQAVKYYKEQADKNRAMNSILAKYDISKSSKAQLVFDAENNK